jgi:hypothetical protein
VSPAAGAPPWRGPGLPAVLAVAGVVCLLVAGVWYSISAAAAASTDVGPAPAPAPRGSAPPWPVRDLTERPATRTPAGRVRAAPAPTVLHLGRQRVKAPVLAMGQQRRALDLPADPRKIGWWAAGAAPGDPAGTTLLAGHVDSATRGLGVLAGLRKIGPDDPVTVTDAAGRVHRYVVASRHRYAKADLPTSVFSTAGSPRLVLVTCGGAFDRRTGHYADNVVVVATPLR